MTRLLPTATSEVHKVPPGKWDTIATIVLDELADDRA